MTYPLLIATACVLFALVAWRDVRHGLCLLAASLPAYLLRFEIGPVPVTLLEAFAVIFVARGFISLKSNADGEPILEKMIRFARECPFAGPTLLLLLAATVSAFVAPDRLSALGIWRAYFVEPMLVFVTAWLVLGETKIKLKDARDKNLVGGNLLVALGIGGAFVAMATILQYALDLGIPAPWDVERRATGVFPYPNAVGLYLAPIVVMAVIRAGSRGVGESGRVALGSLAAIGAVAIVLARSEAAVVAIVASLAVAGLMNARWRRKTAAIIVVAIVTIALSPFRQTVVEKLTFADTSGLVRRSQWRETAAMLTDRPLLGAGLNGYPRAMAPYHRDLHYEIFQYPHTLLFNVWSELGALGVAAFAWLGVAAWRAASSQHARVALAALMTMAIHSLADVAYFKNDLSLMAWLLLAVIAISYAPRPRRA